MPVGWAIAAGAVVGAVGSVVAGSQQAKGQKRAAQTQTDMFNTIVDQQRPYMTSGYGATSRLNELMGIAGRDENGNIVSGDKNAADFGSFTKGFSPEDFLNNLDPGYQFGLKTGGQAVRNAATPAEGALSGSALKGLDMFATDYANTGYSNAFNRWTTQQNNVFARLSGIAGLGENAAANTGAAGTSLGTGIAQAQAGAAASTAAGTQGAFQSIAGGLNSYGGYNFMKENPNLFTRGG